jgi:DNA-binding NtrC family response regulator
MAKKHILLVVSDEQIQMRDLLIEVLQDAGFEVMTMNDWESAAEFFALRFQGIDLVVTDRTFGKAHGGEELIGFIHEILSDFPCILLTGAAEVILPNKHDAVIYKPFRPDRLISTVKHLLNSWEERSAARFPRH